MPTNKNKLAIVAGNGSLTTILAKSANDQGFHTCAMAVTEEAGNNLKEICNKVYRVSPGQVGKMLDFMKNEMIHQVVFIGKVPKLDLLKNVHKLDLIAIKNLSSLSNLNDDTIHNSIVNLLDKHNVKILPQTMFLKHLFIEKEVLSKRKPTMEERVDIEYGFSVAKKVASLDIGQTVIVKNKMILAIEAIEGTDEAIKRGCQLSGGKVIVVKVAKPLQDERFDIPTVGENTIKVLSKYGGGVIAFEGKSTIVTDREKVTALANKLNICLLAV